MLVRLHAEKAAFVRRIEHVDSQCPRQLAKVVFQIQVVAFSHEVAR